MVWNNLTSDFNKLANIQHNSFCNYGSMLNCFDFKTCYSRLQIREFLFFINFFKNKIYCCSAAVLLLVSVNPVRKLEALPPLTSVMSQVLALEQGVPPLETTSTILRAFVTNVTSPFLCVSLLRYIISVWPVFFHCLTLNFSLCLALVHFSVCHSLLTSF
jgi:hypothetical protein